MGLMDSLLSSMGSGQSPLNDLVSKFERGDHAQLDPAQVASHHDAIAKNVGSDEYQQIAGDAFAKLSPDQRAQIGDTLLQHARQQDLNAPVFSQQGGSDPSRLAQMAGELHRQDPSLLGKLLGGGGGNLLQSTAAKAALAGITAMAIKKLQRR
jgi:hypothetical protein